MKWMAAEFGRSPDLRALAMDLESGEVTEIPKKGVKTACLWRCARVNHHQAGTRELPGRTHILAEGGRGLWPAEEEKGVFCADSA